MKLYVGNLPYAVTEARLRGLFEEFGTATSVTVVADKVTGKSKGFAFVEMSDQDAQKAIAALNKSTLDGRTIFVDAARVRS